MPFYDELAVTGVTVLPYQPPWAGEGAELIDRLRRLVPDAVAVEHIRSTSVPGMAAKPCLDMMIVVDDLATSSAARSLGDAGFRRRPEAWNNTETAGGRSWPKMVFAPPVGGQRCNIHVRPAGAPTAFRALLFRDYMIANADKVWLWSDFKCGCGWCVSGLTEYGQIKTPAWSPLMECAGTWAEQTGYQPDWW